MKANRIAQTTLPQGSTLSSETRQVNYELMQTGINMLFEAARRGDEEALQILEESAQSMARSVKKLGLSKSP
jgi:N-acetylglucosamine kinase-like BadF-type ATPase